MSHLHLDALGGVAGDMFAASLLHADPEAAPDVVRHVGAVAAGVSCRVVPHDDGVLTGCRFRVAVEGGADGHDHVAWREIRGGLDRAGLPDPVAARAIAIFGLLADAEASVHGVDPDEVSFHEVGAADSIADIVAAATLIERFGIRTASVSALPLGGGRVETAHGPLPVPAPATTRLLEGFEWRDDGIGGERVTPTGAAILRHLVGAPGAAPPGGRLVRTGIGFGTRRLNGISNCLRALLFEPVLFDTVSPDDKTAIPHRRLAVLTCEIDDQTAEDLATAIGRLRASPAVHDAVSFAVMGKKNRMATRLELLADEASLEATVDAVFRETTTIGLRIAHVDGRTLRRRAVATADGTRVKLVERPGGITGKAEADDVAAAGDAAARHGRRAAAVAAALAAPGSAEEVRS